MPLSGRKAQVDHEWTSASHPGAGRAQAARGRVAAGAGKDITAVCKELDVSEQTYYRWRNQYGGLKADDAKRLRELEKENSTLKRLLADAELDKAALKEIARALVADAPDVVWAIDFQFDATTDGRPIKIANVIAEHTRQDLGGQVARSITGDGGRTRTWSPSTAVCATSA